MKVAVVGGGIAGLAAAWELKSDADVTVFEPGPLGGCIRTTPFGGRPVDEGADAFLTRVPDAVGICREVGIEAELVPPAAGRSLIWWNRRLRPLPDGLVLGVPGRLTGLATSGILSPFGMARASLDLVLPRRRPDPLTVRNLVATRLGREVADRLVDPLVGTIYAGWTGQLGAKEVVPQLVSAAERSRSLILALRASAAPSGEPIFLAPRRGMGGLVSALVGSLRNAGANFVSQPVDSVEEVNGRVLLKPMLDVFDAAILAVPARAAAGILADESAEAPVALAEIRTASVALVTASFSEANIPADVNGFLVPRESGRLMTACSFASNKWPHWAEPGRTLVRLSAGRYGDDRHVAMDDGELVDRLLDELREALGSPLDPIETRVSRWPDAFPQYLPGHAERIAAAEESVAKRFPTVTLAGSSYRGIGIPACIGSGRQAARLAVQRASILAN